MGLELSHSHGLNLFFFQVESYLDNTFNVYYHGTHYNQFSIASLVRFGVTAMWVKKFNASFIECISSKLEAQIQAQSRLYMSTHLWVVIFWGLFGYEGEKSRGKSFLS